MDEIFDRIKALKIKRKVLIISLILTELSGIIVLIWFLKIPLTLKYLTYTPENYSIDSLESEKQYLFKQGDLISGRTEPNSQIQVRLTPTGFNQTYVSDWQGNFIFRIPENIKRGEYGLHISDSSQSYKIRIVSNNRITQILDRLN